MKCQNWFRIALLNFVIAAFMGAVLRFAFIVEIPGLNFKDFLHGHSHLAMLGWVYLGIFCLLIHYYIPRPGQGFTWLFWGAEISALGMLFSFPMQGYAPISIAFSTLHILCSYGFVLYFLRAFDPPPRHRASARFVRAALLFMVLSTLALWGMGPVMGLHLKHQPVYYMLVQAFLHFQFNGWFVFAALGLILFFLEKRGWEPAGHLMQWFFWLLVISCFLTYALAVTWAAPQDFLFILNSLGAAMQLAAFVFLIRLLGRRGWQLLGQTKQRPAGRLMQLALVCLGVKILIQSAVIIPFLAEVAYTIRNFVVGFIHLIQLGIMSTLLLGLALETGWLRLDQSPGYRGLQLFVTGFLLSELLLFLQGLMLWGGLGFLPAYYYWIFGLSALMPVGLFMLWWTNRPFKVTS